MIRAEPHYLDDGPNPDIIQRQASDPEANVWLSASAGTGKTKVLTDRILRLLLPRPNGIPGSAAHHILALTYTKAAAAEMRARVYTILKDWAICDENALIKILHDLCDAPPNAKQILAARALFARVIDSAGGLKIMTIHSFCQSVLGRFPLEAGIAPNFNPLEDSEAASLFKQARNTVLQLNDPTIQSALSNMVENVSQDQFQKILYSYANERMSLKIKNPATLISYLNEVTGLKPNDTHESLIHDYYGGFRDLKSFGDLMATGNNAAKKIGEAINACPATTDFDGLSAVFFKSDGDPYAERSIGAEIYDQYLTEAERLQNTLDKINALHACAVNGDIFVIATRILETYETLKKQRNALDYNDLIFKTLGLLQSGMASWVMYKLDGGLDHILLDEAQDTNPEQWEIIRLLAEEFFNDLGTDRNRTLFVVGDEKQSIYSFQRADPARFETMRQYFAALITQSGALWRDLPMQVSFRSTAPVLNAVDQVFKAPDLFQHISAKQDTTHTTHYVSPAKRVLGGTVEIMPCIYGDTVDALPPWALPVEIIDTQTGMNAYCEMIAQRVSEILSDTTPLSTTNAPAQPRDIMILFKSRPGLMVTMMKIFQKRGLPVSGLDRLNLNQELVIDDLLALARGCLNPEDDLTMASILRSPFYDISQQDLFDIAYNREKSVWHALQTSSKHTDFVTWFQNLIEHAAKGDPYGFYETVLERPTPNDFGQGYQAIYAQMGIETSDILHVFLDRTLHYKRTHMADLQGFILWMDQQEESIKRDLENTSNAIRFMTIHGSKGLQAPIVFLPDTTITQKKRDMAERLLWLKESQNENSKIPFWSANKSVSPTTHTDLRDAVMRDNDSEYWRLLYVAMTRAMENLYISGYNTSKNVNALSWHAHIMALLPHMDGVQRQSFTPPAGTLVTENSDTDTYSLKLEPLKPSIMRMPTAEDNQYSDDIIKQLKAPLPPEPAPPKPLAPSRIENDGDVLSPLEQTMQNAFMQRGTLIHALLQYLPDIDADLRHDKAHAWLKSQDTTNMDVQSMVTETMNVIENPELTALFGPSSMAETPVTGVLGNNNIVSARIDRLVVLEDRVIIADYKTGPRIPDVIPAQYKRQMDNYSALLAMIYPDKKIDSYLIWTAGPTVFDLTKNQATLSINTKG